MTQNIDIDNLGNGKISRLMSRLRSRSVASDRVVDKSSPFIHSLSPPTAYSEHSQLTPPGLRNRPSRSQTSPMTKSPSFRTLLSSSSTRPPSSSSKHWASSPDSTLSSTLWIESYRYLRDAPPTAQLVTAFESIVCQELPDHLKMGGMSMTFRDHPDSKMVELIETIAAAGMSKRRKSKSGGTDDDNDDDDDTKKLLEVGKDMIAEVGVCYGSAAAVAWCGFCTLTPLLLDPLLRRNHDLRRGMEHITGRIRWYMLLDHLLNPKLWKSQEMFKARCSEIKDILLRLFRKVLEFQMNIVCAAASAWNRAAKNVVERNMLGDLVRTLEEMDKSVRDTIQSELVESWSKRLEEENQNLDTDIGGWV